MKAALARSGTTSPFGKLTEQIPAVKIDGETKEKLEHEARVAGLTLLEFVRLSLMIRAHGLDTVQRLMQERLEIVSGEVEERIS